MNYTHCTIRIQDGDTFVAKLEEWFDENGFPEYEPIEVLVDNEWISIHKFDETHKHYTCEGFRKVDFRFQVGDICYMQSRYDGIKKVAIVSQIGDRGRPYYELSEMVLVHKDGDSVGAKDWFEFKGERTGVEYSHSPCIEGFLMKVGDRLRTSTGQLFGIPGGDALLTPEMVENL